MINQDIVKALLSKHISQHHTLNSLKCQALKLFQYLLTVINQLLPPYSPNLTVYYSQGEVFSLILTTDGHQMQITFSNMQFNKMTKEIFSQFGGLALGISC
jgi:hypothetical protein